MPDTKTGRERKGEGKRAQLERHLVERELEADADVDLHEVGEPTGEFLSPPPEAE
jgi:hypothetical protein